MEPSRADHMPVMVKSSGVWRLPFWATYLREKSCRSSATSMAATARRAPATITHVYRRPASRRVPSRRRRPRARVVAPNAAPTSPSHTPATPNEAVKNTSKVGGVGDFAPFYERKPKIGGVSWLGGRGRRHPRRVLGDVVLGVLHHDPVAGEVGALEVALEHDGDPRLEELGRVALVEDGNVHALAL